MTNHWVDIKNADAILIMGSNAAENHPVAFKWIMEAKKNRNATIISVDPRFTRTSSKADIYAPIRSGSDIVFLGGMIKYALDNANKKYNWRYLRDCTNASYFINPLFETCRATGHKGLFSGWTGGTTYGTAYTPDTWGYHKNASLNPIRLDSTLTGDTALEGTCPLYGQSGHETCQAKTVFSYLKEQYSAYTPAMVEDICGTPQNLFLQICEAFCNTYQDQLSATMLYAMGWTQHTNGSQLIRTSNILQLLLGNIGVAGGGINALRGWHNVQGSTDHGVLFDLLTGYNPAPQAIYQHKELGSANPRTDWSYLDTETPPSIDPYPSTNPASSNWWGLASAEPSHNGRSKYVISMLKAWWKDDPAATSYHYLPKRKIKTGGYANLQNPTGVDYSHISLFEDMLDDKIKGLFVWATNPGVTGPDVKRERSALEKLTWMVVCDMFDTETSNFWKRPGGANPTTIKTEVFLLPGAAFFEKKGSVTNSSRLAQWKDLGCDPPGNAKDELWILNGLGAAIKSLYLSSPLDRDKPIKTLNWPYDSSLLGNDLTEGVAKEINGYYLSGATSGTPGQQVASYSSLLTDGQTACGNWLFSGTWPTSGTNKMLNRIPSDTHPDGLGLFANWGYCWPVNRRIIYNRASVYQTDTGVVGKEEGKPLAPDKWVIECTNFGTSGYARPGNATYKAGGDVVDGYAGDRPANYLPFIMRNDGVGRLMGISSITKDTSGNNLATRPPLKDGPFPEHYEPRETPLTANPLTNATFPLWDPLVADYSGATYATSGSTDFPIVCTTYRLTEHWHGGGMSRNLPSQAELMPEPFVEMSEELADTLGILKVNGIYTAPFVTVKSARGNINLRACVTKRFKPFTINGTIVHEVGIPWHWGYVSSLTPPCTGASANELTPHIGDANTRIPEYKAFLVDIVLA